MLAAFFLYKFHLTQLKISVIKCVKYNKFPRGRKFVLSNPIESQKVWVGRDRITGLTRLEETFEVIKSNL